MNFIIDENLPPSLSKSLEALFAGEHRFVHLRDEAKGISDMEWISKFGKLGLHIVISADRRITRNKAESKAFRDSKLIGFFFARSVTKAKLTKKMEKLMALWSDIEKISSTVASGSMFELPIRGKIRPLRISN